MAAHFWHHPQLGAARDRVGVKGVPQRVHERAADTDFEPGEEETRPVSGQLFMSLS